MEDQYAVKLDFTRYVINEFLRVTDTTRRSENILVIRMRLLFLLMTLKKL